MGFHLVDQVYSNVIGTGPSAQAILAYLAFKADDKGNRKCYPSREAIIAATHFKQSAITAALKELRAANILTWVSGGRHKGGGGRAKANEYYFNLPDKPVDYTCCPATPADAAKQPVQMPPDNTSISRETTPIINNHPKDQPSVTDTEAATDEMKAKMISVADHFKVNKSAALQNVEGKRQICRGVLEEAMIAAGVTDAENMKKFASTILGRDHQKCLEVIFEFASEVKAYGRDKMRNPAAVLNARLANLPKIS